MFPRLHAESSLGGGRQCCLWADRRSANICGGLLCVSPVLCARGTQWNKLMSVTLRNITGSFPENFRFYLTLSSPPWGSWYILDLWEIGVWVHICGWKESWAVLASPRCSKWRVIVSIHLFQYLLDVEEKAAQETSPQASILGKRNLLLYTSSGVDFTVSTKRSFQKRNQKGNRWCQVTEGKLTDFSALCWLWAAGKPVGEKEPGMWCGLCPLFQHCQSLSYINRALMSWPHPTEVPALPSMPFKGWWSPPNGLPRKLTDWQAGLFFGFVLAQREEKPGEKGRKKKTELGQSKALPTHSLEGVYPALRRGPTSASVVRAFSKRAKGHLSKWPRWKFTLQLLCSLQVTVHKAQPCVISDDLARVTQPEMRMKISWMRRANLFQLSFLCLEKISSSIPDLLPWGFP